MNACPVCESAVRKVGTKTLLGRHAVEYFSCDTCHYWGTEDPYWLEEAYAEAVGRTDTGLVQRNVSLARQLLPVLVAMHGADATYVDWAGGYGLFVRLMRDYGLDFRWQDLYSKNVLARGFEFSEAEHGGSVAAVTALEALEHSPAPVPFVREIFQRTGASDLFITQELHHGVDFDWWYLSPAGGQHVSFFDATTLRALARRVGASVHTRGSLHLITKRQVSDRWFSWQMASSRFRLPLTRHRLSSRTWADHVQLSED